MTPNSKPDSDSSFEQWISNALEELPLEVHRVLDEYGIEVVIKQIPDGRVAKKHGEHVFGVFTGRPLSEQEGPGMDSQPTRIELYQTVFEKHYSREEKLKEQVKNTVLHEVGHFLGMDEETLREKGL